MNRIKQTYGDICSFLLYDMKWLFFSDYEFYAEESTNYCPCSFGTIVNGSGVCRNLASFLTDIL